MTPDDSGPSLEKPPTPSPAAPPAKPTRKPRSPVERNIVWGGILLLLGLVLIEWRANTGMKSDDEAVHNAMQDSQKGYLTESDLKQLITHSWRHESQTGLTANEIAASRLDTYSYFGVLKDRKLYVYFGLPRPGHEQEVVRVSSEPVRMYTPEDFGIDRDAPKHTKPSTMPGIPFPGSLNAQATETSEPADSDTTEPAGTTESEPGEKTEPADAAEPSKPATEKADAPSDAEPAPSE